jgi:hypothetical protein
MKSETVRNAASGAAPAAGPVGVLQGAVRPAGRVWRSFQVPEPLSLAHQQQQQHAQQNSGRLVQRELAKAGTSRSPSSAADEAALLALRQRAAAALGLPGVESLQVWIGSDMRRHPVHPLQVRSS